MGGLRVAVIGAGIAGLTLAAGLRRAGVACTVFERAGELAEVGAGAQLGPNATLLLHRLGLDEPLREVGVRPAAIELRRWRSGAVIARTELGGACQRKYGAPYYTLHRADLQRALLDLVPGVQLGRRCVGVAERADRVELLFADGSPAVADVVVGADGISSVVRGAVVRDQPRFTGMTVYRGLVSLDRVPWLPAEPRVAVWLGPGQHCVCYPVATNRVSFVASVPAGAWHGESWAEPGDVADLVGAYAHWHPLPRQVLASAETVTRWGLRDRAPAARRCTGRIALIGDAAHPMVPFGAQGANQAIEDAAALAACLRGAGARDVGPALRHFQRVRSARLAQVSAFVRGNAREHHLDDGAAQRRRDRALRQRLRLSGQGWLYGYDAERAAQAGWGRARSTTARAGRPGAHDRVTCSPSGRAMRPLLGGAGETLR